MTIFQLQLSFLINITSWQNNGCKSIDVTGWSLATLNYDFSVSPLKLEQKTYIFSSFLSLCNNILLFLCSSLLSRIHLAIRPIVGSKTPKIGVKKKNLVSWGQTVTNPLHYYILGAPPLVLGQVQQLISRHIFIAGPWQFLRMSQKLVCFFLVFFFNSAH